MSNEMNNSGWQRLGEAVVLQAAKDYRTVLRRLKWRSDSYELIKEKRSLEHFFRSKWFGTLCDMDGSVLVNRIRGEVSR